MSAGIGLDYAMRLATDNQSAGASDKRVLLSVPAYSRTTGENMIRSIAFGVALAFTAMPVALLSTAAQAAAAELRGQQDFDWEIGTWTTKVRVLRNPLSGQAPDWAEYQGTSVVRPLMGGRANFVELAVAGPAGKIEGGALRLYNPQSRQWSLNFASLRNGLLTAPVYGGFDGSGRGVFTGQDMLDGRAILVRFVITQVSKREARFEQAYSADGGATWERNWIAVDTLR
jgi:hypothetical protein